MKKTLKNSSYLLLLCSMFWISSCCSYDDPTLDEVRICGTSPSDEPCEEGLSSLPTTTSFITASALLGAHESTGTVTFMLFVSTEADPIRTEVVNLNSIDSDFEGECSIWLSQGWPVTATLAPSDWRVEVIFEDGGTQSLTKNFSIQ